jgi:hypothetical protein
MPIYITPYDWLVLTGLAVALLTMLVVVVPVGRTKPNG